MVFFFGLYVVKCDLYEQTPSLTSQSCGIYEPNIPQVSEEQRFALVEFFGSTGGQSWYLSDGWGIGDPCVDSWYGVECDCFGNVVSITLPDNGLSGQIPASVNSLTQMRVLDLHSSPRAGDRSNRLSGDIPSLGNLVDLRVLAVSLNSFSQLPSDLFMNANLEILSASGNMLSSLPPRIEELSKLRVMELDDNPIATTFPIGAVCNWQDLLILNFANITMTGTVYDACLESLDPLIVDLFARTVSANDDISGLSGDVPKNLASSWTNIKQGYVSLYLQADVGGHFGSVCSDLRFCFWFNFMSHGDLSEITDSSEIPPEVLTTINLASG
jgi:hypothetical protein